MKPGAKGLTRIINAARYSSKGLKAAYQHEAAFRQELLLFSVAIPLSFLIADSPVEIVLLNSCLLLVLITELINSAIEAVVDRFGGEQHELSGRAKDMGSAAVLLSLLVSVMIWLAVLLD